MCIRDRCYAHAVVLLYQYIPDHKRFGLYQHFQPFVLTPDHRTESLVLNASYYYWFLYICIAFQGSGRMPFLKFSDGAATYRGRDFDLMTIKEVSRNEILRRKHLKRWIIAGYLKNIDSPSIETVCTVRLRSQARSRPAQPVLYCLTRNPDIEVSRELLIVCQW